jgi:hypothetical protein
MNRQRLIHMFQSSVFQHPNDCLSSVGGIDVCFGISEGSQFDGAYLIDLCSQIHFNSYPTMLRTVFGKAAYVRSYQYEC